ncbi:hypothetical protein H4R35_005207 [Dimargaris xerosporica]|nr:hypothetical protein H4R35_005207 [Dimargaris xerosporica]
MSDSVGSFYDDQVKSYAQQTLRPLSIGELARFGRPPLTDDAILRSARFTQSELPVRLAKRLQGFQRLPFIVGTNPNIHAVYRLYYEAFEVLRSFPPIDTTGQEQEYSQMLQQQIKNLANVIPQVAQGFRECKKYMSSSHIQKFLDELIHSRIGLRLIGEQHVALHDVNQDYIGIIHTCLNPADLLRGYAYYVQNLCEVNYNVAPDFVINGAVDTVVQYVPVHLEYIACELLKNAFRATAEHSKKHQAGRPSPIEITVARSKKDICIRFRDQGGGIAAKDLPHVFEYSFTTVENEPDDSEIGLGYATKVAMQSGIGGPMAGLGYGLPMARIYACYFGGSLDLVSLEGHGCDVFLKLKNIDISDALA